MGTFRDFLEDEIKEIERYKWIISEQNHRDMSGVAECEWIEKYALIFRIEWEKIHGPVEELSGKCYKCC